MTINNNYVIYDHQLSKLAFYGQECIENNTGEFATKKEARELLMYYYENDDSEHVPINEIEELLGMEVMTIKQYKENYY